MIYLWLISSLCNLSSRARRLKTPPLSSGMYFNFTCFSYHPLHVLFSFFFFLSLSFCFPQKCEQDFGRRHRVMQNRFRSSNENTKSREHIFGYGNIRCQRCRLRLSTLYIKKTSLFVLLPAITKFSVCSGQPNADLSSRPVFSPHGSGRGSQLELSPLYSMSGSDCASCNVSWETRSTIFFCPACFVLVISDACLLWSSKAVRCLVKRCPDRLSIRRLQRIYYYVFLAFVHNWSFRRPVSRTIKGSCVSNWQHRHHLVWASLCFSFLKLSVLQSRIQYRIRFQ